MTEKQAQRKLWQLQRGLALKLDGLASRMTRGEITPRVFLLQSKAAVRAAHTSAAALGQLAAGADPGAKPREEAAAAAARRVLAAEKDFLKGFRADLLAGKYRRKDQGGRGAQARKGRAALYALKLRATAAETWTASMPGVTEFLWVLGVTDQHCPECVTEAGRGWRRKGELHRMPGDGSTSCVTRCRCHVETALGARGFATI